MEIKDSSADDDDAIVAMFKDSFKKRLSTNEIENYYKYDDIKEILVSLGCFLLFIYFFIRNFCPRGTV